MRERERERERKCLSVRVRESQNFCVCVCVSEKQRVCVERGRCLDGAELRLDALHARASIPRDAATLHSAGSLGPPPCVAGSHRVHCFMSSLMKDDWDVFQKDTSAS